MISKTMFRFVFICFSVISAFAQQDVLQVVRVEDIMPLLSTLINAGSARIGGAAEHLAEFVPTGNLQGAVGSGVTNLVQAVQTPLSSGTTASATFLKGFGVGKHMPVIGSLFPSFATYNDLKESPAIPTLPPLSPPDEAARLAADMGIKTSAVKNTIATVASLPVHAIAAGADKVAKAFEDKSNMLLGTPSQINQLLQFQHSLFESYLAGMNEADTAVPPHALRDELKRLSMMQPQLTQLVTQFEEPTAAGALASLGKAFDIVRMPTMTEDAEETNVAESLLIDTTSMKLAFANIVLNFLGVIPDFEGATTRLASDP